MENDRVLLGFGEIDAQIADTAFRRDGSRLVAEYETGDFSGAVRLLDRVAEAAEEFNHHPDVRLAWGRIVFELRSHDVGGVTARDIRLAHRIERLAAG
ncbi:4a-hydroxytetrahydrobiopterin dehydratase [Agromyces protaetiae]|uniref:Putative pterin-4-alpha-carbinolamine dehydratase n=1 Tax=Agromyces protaetiae TaxID=2509455 RepID=A0A4P6FK35_9MICO|nr:4a-hydroxytetrahydrobiopterin dehydratase [Agromyces protaetiae]QAY74347.1 4a-hydroxytetrahydrobiopterin dehydratase [Agromyces protaetiae]